MAGTSHDLHSVLTNSMFFTCCTANSRERRDSCAEFVICVQDNSARIHGNTVRSVKDDTAQSHLTPVAAMSLLIVALSSTG